MKARQYHISILHIREVKLGPHITTQNTCVKFHLNTSGRNNEPEMRHLNLNQYISFKYSITCVT